MNKITRLFLFLGIIFSLSTQAQVDRIYTDYEGFWASGVGDINNNQPANSHNLLGFRVGSTIYSTGVDDVKLGSEVAVFTDLKLRALPFNSLPTSGGGSYFIALGQLFDGINNGVNTSTTEPFEAGLSSQELTQFLTNGIRGLNLASGFSNIPTSNTFEFKLSSNGITESSINDGEPDILVSQIAQPSGSRDRARFVDVNGDIVGEEVSFRLTNSPKVADWKIDFYRFNSQAGITNTERDIRFQSLELSDFKITSSNYTQIVAFEYEFGGDSDPAFIAYNEESISVARQLSVIAQPFESDCDGAMASNFEVQVEDFNGDPVEQAGFAITAFIETGPGELLGTVTQTTGANGIAIFDDLVFEIGDFHSIRFENTSMEPGISSVIELEGICTDSEWNGSVSSEWNNASNWTPTVIPNANFNVLIPSGAPNYPVLQANAGAKNLVMEDDTSINLNGNIFAISGDITLGTNSTLTGSTSGSNLYFSGSGPQVIPDDFIVGNLDILTIENASGVSSNTDIVLTSLLSVINGDFNTNNSLTLACQFTPVRKTAQVGPVGGSIMGNVTTEQCFPANRAYRLVTSSVTTSNSSIRENWQENPDLTDPILPGYQDNPRPGYGTHITGVEPGTSQANINQDGENGFDYNPSGSPSMFTFDNVSSLWNQVPNTTDDFTAGFPFRLMIRGDRSIDITNNNTQARDTRLSTYGGLITGNYSNSNINTNPTFLSLIGNPYHAQVDMEAVLNGSINLRENAVYVWDPTVNTRGAYVTVLRSAGNWSNNNSGSDANRYLQPMQAVFVETSNLGSPPQINFRESYKSVSQPQTTVFSTSPENFIQMNLYSKNSFEDKSYNLDGLKLIFDNNFNEGSQDDFSKLQNDDENMARINNGNFLSAEQRPYPSSEETLPLFFNNYRHSNYVLELDIADDINFKIFVEDKYLNQTQEINSSANTYAFTVDNSIPESEASDRFSLVFEPISLSTPEENISNLSLYPNPTQGNFRISGRDLEQGAELEIYNMIGQQVYKKSLRGQSSIEITDFNANTGLYLVKLKTNQGERTFKLIKE